jgi:hypothetical protein
MHRQNLRPVPACPPEGTAGPPQPGQAVTLDDLTDYQRRVVRLRAAHVLEAETGFRNGSPLRPGPGEPRAGFDPRSTTLEQRRQAKVAELKALGAEEAALLGLGQVSERTLKRLAAALRDMGLAGCIHRRWARPCTGHESITEEVRGRPDVREHGVVDVASRAAQRGDGQAVVLGGPPRWRRGSGTTSARPALRGGVGGSPRPRRRRAAA